MQEHIVRAAIVGLLHDIGKFAQRAGVSPAARFDPQEVGAHGAHAIWSADFVARHLPPRWREGMTGVLFHHAPKSPADYLIQLADWLSSGEREQETENQERRLRSVFGRLWGQDERWYYSVQRLQLSEAALFPSQPDAAGVDISAEYAALWAEFTQACQARRLADIEDGEALLETLYHLLELYTSNIPSAYYKNVPDVSLFDHSRTTAALAACLAADGWSADDCRLTLDGLRGRTAAQPPRQHVCLLVGADVSGIQDFIYTLASSGAAKSLRGRSFYLQLLTEVIAHYTLHRLQIPLTNLLYVGGGHFFLLAPVGAADELQAVRKDVGARLLAIHGGELRLVLDWLPLAPLDFTGARFGEMRDRLGQRLQQVKQRPLADLDAGLLTTVLGKPLEQGGAPEEFCHVCGRGENLRRDPNDDNTLKCRFCLSLETLGSMLRTASHLALYRVPASEIGRIGEWADGLRAFGTEAQLWPGDEMPKPPASARFGRIYRLGLDPATHPPRLMATAQTYGFPTVIGHHLLAQLVPLTWDEGTGKYRIATLEDLTKASRGLKRWGVLRMDVDSLGRLFREGLRGHMTLSRVASLSFRLRLFFEAWLPEIGRDYQELSRAPATASPSASGERKGSDRLYLQYAGGDDVFLIGAWDVLPEVAARIRTAFAAYVCRHPRITLSAGISLHDDRFPIYQAARQAGEAEDAAKTSRRIKDGQILPKDAVHFLGVTLGWEEFDEARTRAHRLADWCEDGRAPRALLQLLLMIYEEWQTGLAAWQARHGQQQEWFYYGRWMWMLVYSLTRAAEQSKSPEVRSALTDLRDNLLSKNSPIRYIGLSARWAQFLTRSGG